MSPVPFHDRILGHRFVHGLIELGFGLAFVGCLAELMSWWWMLPALWLMIVSNNAALAMEAGPERPRKRIGPPPSLAVGPQDGHPPPVPPLPWLHRMLGPTHVAVPVILACLSSGMIAAIIAGELYLRTGDIRPKLFVVFLCSVALLIATVRSARQLRAYREAKALEAAYWERNRPVDLDATVEILIPEMRGGAAHSTMANLPEELRELVAEGIDAARSRPTGPRSSPGHAIKTAP